MGPFFRRFGRELRDSGVRVTKINFNGGDAFYYRDGDAIPYKGDLAEWPAFFERFVQDSAVDAVFLFGDCRPIHKPAVEIAKRLGVAVWVFEEGYLRPDHITLEPGGVNGNSALPKDPDFYRDAVRHLPSAPADIPVGHTFLYSAWHAAVYACMLSLGWPFYRRYKHHRSLSPFVQAFYWVRGFWRKRWFAFKERGILEKAAGAWSGDYYMVPLQVHNDYQIQHSNYERFEDFMDEVVRTFAASAPEGTKLILKHHPQDRAYRDYTRYIRELGERYSCGDRLIYVHDVHLPTLLKNARGTITMNSTVGTSSLYHGTPVKTMGRAIYDIPGLTFAGRLEEFFREPGQVDEELYRDFNRYLRETNQINGSFYKSSTNIFPERELCKMAFGKPAAGRKVLTREV
jgi:capsule polysaccharide modification protein KpsS